MRATGFRLDIPLGKRGDPIIRIEINCFSIYPQKSFHALNSGLILESLPPIGTALQRNTY
jgi:hypothetical protein